MQHLPMDVRQVTSAQLAADTATHADIRRPLVARWPCQDQSAAGQGLGLAGSHSSAFCDPVRILGCMQQLLPSPPAYLLESTYTLWGAHINIHQLSTSYWARPSPRLLHAWVRCLRLRMFWTNLQAAEGLHLA